MGPEDSSVKEMVMYCGDTPIGRISEIPEITDLQPPEGIEVYDDNTGETVALLRASETDGTLTLHFTATMWAKCRSRKRFIKLMAGVFGMQRNEASQLAEAAMSCGCPSYQDLWADCYAYFVKYAMELMATANGTDQPSGASE